METEVDTSAAALPRPHAAPVTLSLAGKLATIAVRDVGAWVIRRF